MEKIYIQPSEKLNTNIQIQDFDSRKYSKFT